jgi:hypothetical protein
LTADLITVEQGINNENGSPGLATKLQHLANANGLVEVLTPTFTPPEIKKMKTYDLMASPLLYPGQTLKALLRTSKDSTASIQVRFRFKAYGKDDELVTIDSKTFIELAPGAEQVLEYTIADNMDHQPIQQIGVSLLVPSGHFTGTVWLDYLRWDGTPQLTLRRPKNGPCDFWRQAWVNGVSKFHQWGPSFFLAQDAGEGIISHGTREWKDYRMSVSNFRVNLGGPAGVAVRVQGLRRYYAFLFKAGNRVAIVKALDDEREELASAEFDWQLDLSYQVGVIVKGNSIRAQIDGKHILEAKNSRFAEGGIGFIVTDGSIAAEEVQVDPVD